jgi:phosphatidylethanolamine-binding protein (PEBP) family uncharacterized protein
MVGTLPEGVKDKELSPGTLHGLNDWEKTGYGGPCPPIGQHRYFHKLYALDTLSIWVSHHDCWCIGGLS